MSVARWTPSPFSEREVAEAARASARKKRWIWIGFLAMLMSCPLTCWALVVAPWLALAALAYTLCAARLTKWATQLPEQGAAQIDAATLEEFGAREGWLVELLVHQGEAPTGADRGMLWFEDGRLYFAGRRTSFGLTADQATGPCRHVPPLPGHRHELELRLRERTPGGQVAISFKPLAPAKWQDRASAHDLRERVDRWARGIREGDGQLPPLDIGPDAPSSGTLLVQAAFAATFWTALVVGFFALNGNGGPLWAVPYAMVGLMIGVVWSPLWSPYARLRAYFDRLRLEESV